MAAIPFHIVDVFAEQKYAGNQLAVFRNAAGTVRAKRCRRSRRRWGSPRPRSSCRTTPRDGGYDVRIFTPAAEVPFAGHPTLGTAYIIRQRDPRPGRGSGEPESQDRADPRRLRASGRRRGHPVDDAEGGDFPRGVRGPGDRPPAEGPARGHRRRFPHSDGLHGSAVRVCARCEASTPSGGPPSSRISGSNGSRTARRRWSFSSAARPSSRRTRSTRGCSPTTTASRKTRPPAAPTVAWPPTWSSTATSARIGSTSGSSRATRSAGPRGCTCGPDRKNGRIEVNVGGKVVPVAKAELV